MKPKVTIGICARNREDTIEAAIESAIAQDYPHKLLELLIVDDGSEDKTFSLIKKYVNKTDISTRVFSQKWRGLGYTRNFVIQNAEGKYLIWLDADEIFEKSYVRKHVSFLESHPATGISVGILEIPVDNLVTKLDLMPFSIDRLKFLASGSDLRPPGTGGTAFRIEALRKVGGFDENLEGAGEDVDISYRILRSGWSVGATTARYWEKRGGITTLQALLTRYFWYGYGNNSVHWKYGEAIGFTTMTPPVAFVSGLFYGVDGYRLTRDRRLIFLLPVTFVLKYSAWCLGFTKGHFEQIRKKRR